MVDSIVLAIVTRVFSIVLARRGEVEAALVNLSKRATRRGLPDAFAWTWGRVTEGTKGAPDRIALEIVGEEPKLNGWLFVAALDHMSDDQGNAVNVVRTVPGTTVPEMYRNRGPVCDHCQANRRRGATYVLRHEDGKTVQVGSTCLQDFLGADAFKCAARAEILAEIDGTVDEGASGGGASDDRALSTVLPMVAAIMRQRGWTSRGKAREEGGRATADLTLAALTPGLWSVKNDGPRPDITDADIARAEAAQSWAETLTDETINSESGDYLHNCRAIARCNLVTLRSIGIAASIVSAYERALDRIAEAVRAAASVHFGTVGKREMFTLTLARETSFETQYGTTYLYTFNDSAGNVAIWKASSHQDMTRGDTYKVTGSVKEHSEFRGVRQTVLTRCKIAPIAVAA